MKITYFLLPLVVSIGLAQAGGFGGPPALSGGSPLALTGIDGSYQAVASAVNVTGLFSFAIQNGVQTQSSTASDSNNSWIFFVDGNILSGSVAANVSNDQVAGVLDSGLGNNLTTTGTTGGASVYVIPGNAAAGYYNGTIDLSSPISAFEGEGALQGTPSRTDQIVVITTGTGGSAGGVDITPIVIPGSTFDVTTFKFRGTRLSIRVSGTN
ncbi:MAG: hypothetical protein ACOYMS_01565 [Terrimicrobiaceae bacterium]